MAVLDTMFVAERSKRHDEFMYVRDVVELGRFSVRLRELRFQSLTRHAEIKPKLFSRTLRSRRTSVCTPQSGLCTYSTYPLRATIRQSGGDTYIERGFHD